VSNERIEATGYKRQYSIEMGICELQKGFRILRLGVTRTCRGCERHSGLKIGPDGSLY